MERRGQKHKQQVKKCQSNVTKQKVAAAKQYIENHSKKQLKSLQERNMDLKPLILALRRCGRSQSVRHGISLHSHIIKHGFFHDIFMANNLLSMYVDFTYLNDAHKLFDEMTYKNIVTWTTMVSAYTSNKRPDEAIKLYNHMLECDLEAPNGFMYSAVLKACALAGDLQLGRLIHKRISRENLDNDTVLMNTLLDMYVKCGIVSDAKKVFDNFFSANSTSWNTIISGYCKEGLMEEAISLFHQMPKRNVISWNSIIAGLAHKGSFLALEYVCMMHKEGLKLDEFTLPCGLKACSYFNLLAMGKQIHCYVVKSGFECSCFIVSALVDMYSNCNLLSAATKLFDQYSSCDGLGCDSLALWNSMLSGYIVNEKNKAALCLLSQIHSSGVCIDSYTFSSAVKVCLNLLNLRLGLQVHGLIVTCGYESDYVVGSILIDLYAKLGNVKNALKLFHRLPNKDIVAWSGLIMGCAKMGLNSLAFSLFRDMINLDLEVDQFVVSSVLKVCSSLASVGSGKQDPIGESKEFVHVYEVTKFRALRGFSLQHDFSALALKFSSSISTLAEKLVKRMTMKSSRTGGKYVSIHLRFEEDMVAFSCCSYDGGKAKKIVMDSFREKWCKGKFKRKDRVILPGVNRINGKCPLTPLEVGMMLRGMGFDNNTSIFLASGKIYQAERHLAPLLKMFPLLYTKESLATQDELAPFKEYPLRLAALDYTVCLFSEVFVTTHGVNFPHFLMGHRRFLFDGHAKTIKPDKIKLVVLLQDMNISWRTFKDEMEIMLSESDRKGMMVPRLSKINRKTTVYTYPLPECSCLLQSDNTTLKLTHSVVKPRNSQLESAR
ncbi:hypothetical protein Q3G72_000161 [Acer saccharum]|nr:hypothetical protein Q3G72_000161 [Acer saccharum]